MDFTMDFLQISGFSGGTPTIWTPPYGISRGTCKDGGGEGLLSAGFDGLYLAVHGGFPWEIHGNS